MNIGIVVGNPNPRSRTLQVAGAVADAVASIVEETNRFVVDLIDYSAGLFDWEDAEVTSLVDEAAAVDFLIVATPTYKAAYTGLLKAFLDRFDTNRLHTTVAIPVMTGGSPHHSLAPEMTLRPLLAELGASTPTTSLYFITSDMSDLARLVDSWLVTNRAALLGAAHARRLHT